MLRQRGTLCYCDKASDKKTVMLINSLDLRTGIEQIRVAYIELFNQARPILSYNRLVIGASLSEPHMGSKSVPRELSIYLCTYVSMYAYVFP